MPKTTSKRISRKPTRKAASRKKGSIARQASPKVTQRVSRGGMSRSTRAEEVAARQVQAGKMGMLSAAQKSSVRGSAKGSQSRATVGVQTSRSLAARKRK